MNERTKDLLAMIVLGIAFGALAAWGGVNVW